MKSPDKIAMTLAEEKTVSLGKHLARALSEWMLDNMPGDLINKIVWRLDDTHVVIYEKSAKDMTDDKVTKLSPSGDVESVCMEMDTKKMLENALGGQNED